MVLPFMWKLPSTECVPTVTVYTHCKMALPFEPADAVLEIDLSIETGEESTKFDILSCTSYAGSISCSGTDFKINASIMLVSCPVQLHSPFSDSFKKTNTENQTGLNCAYLKIIPYGVNPT